MEWKYWQDSSQTQSFREVDHSLGFHLEVCTTPKHFSISANFHLHEGHVGLHFFAVKTLGRILKAQKVLISLQKKSCVHVATALL